MITKQKNNKIMLQIFKSFMISAILTELISQVGMVIDAVMVSNLMGNSELAAINLMSPIEQFLKAIAGVIATGGAALCAEAIGQNDKQKVKENFSLICMSILVVGSVFTIVLVGFHVPIARLLGAQDEMLSKVASYILGFGIGVVPFCLSVFMLRVVKIDGSKNLTIWATIALVVVNIIGDYLFIKIFHLGLFGAGFATSLSYLICTGVCLLRLFNKESQLRIIRVKIKWHTLRNAFWMGGPYATLKLCLAISSGILNSLLLGAGGVGAVVALSVRKNVYALLNSLVAGVAAAIFPIIGILSGERDRQAIKETSAIIIRYCFISSIVTAILMVAGEPLFLLIFNISEPTYCQYTYFALTSLAISMPFSAMNLVLTNIFQITEKVHYANIINFLLKLVLLVPLAVIGAKVAGTYGIFGAYALTEMIMILGITIFVWIKEKKINIDSFLMLKNTYPIEFEEEIFTSATDSKESMEQIFHTLDAFCMVNEIEGKNAYRLRICTEELVQNIIRINPQLKDKLRIDIRIIYTNGELVLRMRDNGKKYHQMEYINSLTSEELGDNYELRILKKMASSYSYQYSLGVNNSIISLRE